MEPIDFAQANTVFGQDQPEYKTLPGHRDKEGLVTTCWMLSHAEIETIKYTGVLWVQLHTMHTPLQPVNVQVEEPELSP